MKKIFKSPGGQYIRQQQDCGNNLVYVTTLKTNYDELGYDPSDSYTDWMWSFEIDNIERWVKDWAYHPELIEIKVVELDDTVVL